MAKGKFVSYLRVALTSRAAVALVWRHSGKRWRAISMAAVGSWSPNTLRQRAGGAVTVRNSLLLWGLSGR